ncbi:TraB/GumN family protein [Tsuneonella flava]|uniref:TraB/GumN family protein n=1 Tax=Tsuneonella flava TaxID=2055955 RepID=A0ABX7K6W9_9SPHN|nr:TraB/GumN family protein [Tsuneonella flava]QSB43986.1 TraB/GumN family protein [Tsuneonella flava]
MRNLLKKSTSTLASFAVLFSTAGCATAQAEQVTSAPAPVTTAAPSEAPAGPALWKIADDDTTIYLFGTVHALPDDIDWQTGQIGTALETADTLVTEVIVSDSNTAEMQKLVAAKGMLPAKQTLRGLLDDDQRAKYDAAMTGLGLPTNAFDRFKPWYASLLLTMIPLAQQGIDVANGVEKSLEANTRPEVKREALETAEYQLSLFDSLSQESQIDMMMKTIDGQDKVAEQLEAMIADWLAGDADGLARLMNESIDEPALLERLLYQRNRNWAQWLQKRLDTPGTVFVAVGAGHLAGQNSVQEDLTKMGIKVDRVQ